MKELKKIIALFFFAFSFNVYCQSLVNDIVYWNDELGKHPTLITISDSLIQNEIDNSIYGMNNKRYFFETRYMLKNGNEVVVNIFNDTNVLYREYKNGKLLHQGELHKNYKRSFVYEVTDTLTGETTGTDTTYYMTPFGLWMLNENNENYEFGMFENGIRTGTWQLMNKMKFNLPVTEKIFINGIVIDTTQIDFSKSKDINALITKEWKRRGVIIDPEKDIIHVVYVTHDSVDLKLGQDLEFAYNELQLNKDFTFTGHRIQKCGTGMLNQNYLNPKGSWKLMFKRGNQNVLRIEDELYQIDYLSDEILILKLEKDI